MKNVFISRNLRADSEFNHLLKDKATVTGRSLLEFQAVDFVRIPDADCLFFYSKNAIKYCLSQLSVLDYLPKIAVMGKASAEYLNLNYNIKADFIGTGEPLSTSIQFLDFVKDQRVVFVQAKNSRRSIQKLVDFNATDLIVYDNFAITDFALPASDILVFTSPMNAEAYFSKYSYLANQNIIAIGETTAGSLKKKGLIGIIIAKEANEKALADACLTLL